MAALLTCPCVCSRLAAEDTGVENHLLTQPEIGVRLNTKYTKYFPSLFYIELAFRNYF